MTDYRNRIWNIALGGAVLLVPGTAVAQDSAASVAAASESERPSSGKLDEIVVTATKRSTTEQTTPQSITAFNTRDLNERNVTSINDLALFTPGLFVGAESGFGNTTTAIRGMGPLNAGLGADEAVGIYIDGVYQGTPYGNTFTFIDIDQVEVLRGPQGTLYGRNATGGAILVNSFTPGDDTVIRADVGIGTIGDFKGSTYQGSALVGGPISDTLSGKIAIGRTSRDGWTKNPLNGEKLNGETNLNSSAGLYWTPNEVWKFALTGRYGSQDTTMAYKDANDGLPIDIVPALFPNKINRSFGGVTTNVTGTFPGVTLTAIAGWTSARLNATSSSANIGLTQLAAKSSGNQFYEELRLASNGDGPFSWIIGATGNQIKVSDTVNFVITDNLIPGGLGLLFDSRLKTESYSAFGEIAWQLTDQLRVTLGNRYTHDRKDWDNCVAFNQFTNLLDGQPHPQGCLAPFLSESRTWSAWTPKAVVDLKLTNRIFAYASFNKGFRSGGWNNTSPINPAAPFSTGFDPEYATSYEAGLKTEFFDRRLRVNIAAYLTNYRDLQVRTIDPVYNLLGVHSAGAARAKGVELQVTAQPTPELNLGMNVAFSHATYTSFAYLDPAVGPIDYSGNYLNNAPRWTANFSAGYRFELGEGKGSLTPRVDLSYCSHTYYTGANEAPYDGKPKEEINLRLRYEAASKPWGFELYVDNLTDRQWRQYAFQGVANVVGAAYAAPRTMGIRLFWNR